MWEINGMMIGKQEKSTLKPREPKKSPKRWRKKKILFWNPKTRSDIYQIAISRCASAAPVRRSAESLKLAELIFGFALRRRCAYEAQRGPPKIDRMNYGPALRPRCALPAQRGGQISHRIEMCLRCACAAPCLRSAEAKFCTEKGKEGKRKERKGRKEKGP